MGKRVVFGGLLVILAACGGHIDADTQDREPSPTPQRDDEQGLYFPADPKRPQRVAEGLGTPSAIAMTDERVLFTTRNTVLAGETVEAGALFASNKHGGTALALTIDRRGASFDALTTDGTTAFIATSDARLLAIPAYGGNVTTLATLAAPAVTLTASGAYLYFATDTGALARIAKTGGDVEQLATITGAIRGLDADETAVYVATGAAEELPAGIVRVPFDGGAVKVLTSGGEPCAMIRDGRRLFWTSLAPAMPASPAQPAKGEVRRLSLEALEVATVASGSFSACAITADSENLYFATTVPTALGVKATDTRGSATAVLGLMRAPIGGGAPVAVADDVRALSKPGAMTIDATHVYWLTATAVLRLQK
jgi:hypothetical protein